MTYINLIPYEDKKRNAAYYQPMPSIQAPSYMIASCDFCYVTQTEK